MKLQNHFTTIEQSKRLLELGVPANSADCCIIDDCMNKGMEILTEPYSEYVNGCETIFVPCWSVGRLMEITDIVAGYPVWNWNFNIQKGYIEQVIEQIEFLKDNYGYDYSKLEERI